MVRITVLGKSPAWQDAGGACSGYLIQEDGATVLLECGNGVFGKLRGTCDYLDVDAVVVSHMHADHFLDLIPFAYALTYSPRRRAPGAEIPDRSLPRPLLYLPEGGAEKLGTICAAFHNYELVEDAFELHEYEPGDTITAGSLHVRFRPVPHWVPANAVEFSSAIDGTGRFTFGSDHGPSEELIGFARDTDLLMLEATVPQPEQEETRGHLTPAEAGMHARAAGARRLVLTHISDELDRSAALAAASETFGGAVEIAAAGDVYTV